jgi:D-glycero-D-manno-heptose 1,7-bisphosphate phosphatase
VSDTQNSSSERKLRTVFLDRDGVLNEKMPEGSYVATWGDFHMLPGVGEAIARLNQAGLRVMVVTNQRGVALGKYTEGDVEAIHAGFQELLKGYGAHVDGFFFCPHDKGECDCRKPLTGLFDQAVARFPEIRAESSAVVGDSLSDIEFGRRVGMRTVLVESNPERRKPGFEKAVKLADVCVGSLPEAVDALLIGRA